MAARNRRARANSEPTTKSRAAQLESPGPRLVSRLPGRLVPSSQGDWMGYLPRSRQSHLGPWRAAPSQPRLHTMPDPKRSTFRQPVGGLSLPGRRAPSVVRCARYESAFRECVEAAKRPSSRNSPMNGDDSLSPPIYIPQTVEWYGITVKGSDPV